MSLKIFEFQFNPQEKKDLFFKVFSFEPPQNNQDLGTMYIIGELTNALPINRDFLDRLGECLGKEYYTLAKETSKTSPRQRLKSALKKANNFLAQEAKEGNVDWLGNLHLLLMVFPPLEQGYSFYFTKTGKTKLWLVRAGTFVDAGKHVEQSKKDGGSLAIFENVGSGKLISQDRVIGATQEIFDFFAQRNFLSTFAQLKEEKQFRHLFKKQEKYTESLSGILFFVLVESSPFSQMPVQGRHLFSLLSTFSLKALPLFSSRSEQKPPSPLAATNSSLSIASETKKRIILLGLFLLLLMIGFVILRGKSPEDPSGQETQGPTRAVQEQTSLSSKITEITELIVLRELNSSLEASNPQHFLWKEDRFYFFGPSSTTLSMFDKITQTSQTFTTGKNLALGTILHDSLFFFAQPDTIISVDQQGTILQHSLSLPIPNTQFVQIGSFASNLYLLDARNGEIFKSAVSPSGPGPLERWIDLASPKRPLNARSLTIDGSLWILSGQNEIQRYFRGAYQETLDLTIVPKFQEPTLMKTNSQLPYLYILEPKEERLVILTKSGELIRQYRNPTLAQVSDFAISPDGRAISLFDGKRIYQLMTEQ